jgi:hypothetical protein
MLQTFPNLSIKPLQRSLHFAFCGMKPRKHEPDV